MLIVWRHYMKAGNASGHGRTMIARRGPVSAHAFADGALISACGIIPADSPRLEPAERDGDRRCAGCERAIARHGEDIPYGIVNVNLEAHAMLQCEALRTGRSIRAISDDVITRMLDAIAPNNPPPAAQEAA